MSSPFETPNGWADDRLMQAYDLIWEVERDNNQFDIDTDVRNILASIELLSSTIVQERRDAA